MGQAYKTKDMYEASALIAKGVKAMTLERGNGHFWFVFSEGDSCSRLSEEYWRDELEVRAKDYADAIRSLKDRLFAKG